MQKYLKLVPIGRTEIDWKNYATITKETLKYDPVRGLNSKDIEHNIGFVILEPSDHISYTFMLVGTREFFLYLMQRRNIINISVKETKNEEFYLGTVSGTLFEWKNLILELCQDGSDCEERRF